MKYKLLKDLPLAKAGTEVKISCWWIADINNNAIKKIDEKDITEWLEEVKEETKRVKNLSNWGTYYYLNRWMKIIERRKWNEYIFEWHMFLTEREAKRNKLLRELATREKWLPEKHENYIAIGFKWEASKSNWTWCPFEYADYHNWLVFRNEEEYYKYITPEAEDLLFKI